MNAITAELTNLANGSLSAGDRLAAKICRDAIAEINRLQGLVDKQRTAIDGLIAAIKSTTEWGRHDSGCWLYHGNKGMPCGCAHDALHAAVDAADAAECRTDHRGDAGDPSIGS